MVTSPPYLNAIDYMRGHKMSLVWMGWTIGALRDVRGEAVGVERMTGQRNARGENDRGGRRSAHERPA